MIVPMYQAELCHPSIRGRVTSLQQFMLGVGALSAAWISYGTISIKSILLTPADTHIPGAYVGFEDHDPKQWQVSLGIQIIPAGILALLISFFPESPRWLIAHGQEDKGLATLARLHANDDENDAWVRAEFLQIQDSLAAEREEEASSYLALFKDKSSFRRLFLACALQASVQMTGVSAIQYYSVQIYAKIGIAGDETLRYQAISSVLALVAEVICMLLIDRTGRRWPLIGGNLANMVTFIVATVLLAKFPPGSGSSGTGSAGWAFIVMTWLYNFSFSLTCGPLSWIIPAEIFDTKTRSKGVSIATMTSFAFNTMIGQTTSVALDEKNGIGWRWYIVFIVSFLFFATVCAHPHTHAHVFTRSATSPTPSSSGRSCPRPPSDRSRRCVFSSPRRRCSSPRWTLTSSRHSLRWNDVSRRFKRSRLMCDGIFPPSPV